VLCVAGGAIAWATVRTQVVIPATTQANIAQPCHDPALAEPAA